MLAVLRADATIISNYIDMIAMVEGSSIVAEIRGNALVTKSEVLFVCVHNAGRSQMAAALLHHLGGAHVTVRSAGSQPSSSLNPVVVEAMAEIGIDISMEFPKPLTYEGARQADVIITMGCGDTCPVFPGKTYLDWQLDDPAGRDLAAVRVIRDDIAKRVRELYESLTRQNERA